MSGTTIRKTYTPVQAAKELNCRPQALYSLIKRGKIPTAPGLGKADVITLEDAQRALQGVRPKGSITGSGKGKGGARSPVRRGAILSYTPQPGRSGLRRFRQVTEINPYDEDHTYVHYKTTSGDSWQVDTNTLQQELRKQTYQLQIEAPYSLLQMIVEQFRNDGREGLANSLESWTRSNMDQVQEASNATA